MYKILNTLPMQKFFARPLQHELVKCSHLQRTQAPECQDQPGIDFTKVYFGQELLGSIFIVKVWTNFHQITKNLNLYLYFLIILNIKVFQSLMKSQLHRYVQTQV
jgi:hypothetical protein